MPELLHNCLDAYGTSTKASKSEMIPVLQPDAGSVELKGRYRVVSELLRRRRIPYGVLEGGKGLPLGWITEIGTDIMRDSSPININMLESSARNQVGRVFSSSACVYPTRLRQRLMWSNLGPVGHTLISTALGGGIRVATDSPEAAASTVGVGVLMDLDHRYDYCQRYIKGNLNKTYLFLHAREYSTAGLGILPLVFYHPLLLQPCWPTLPM